MNDNMDFSIRCYRTSIYTQVSLDGSGSIKLQSILSTVPARQTDRFPREPTWLAGKHR